MPLQSTDATAELIRSHDLKVAATTNMMILGFTFDDDNPALVTTDYGEFMIPTIKPERSKHGEHTTIVYEIVSPSFQISCQCPQTQVLDSSHTVRHQAVTTMGSTSEAVNPPAQVYDPSLNVCHLAVTTMGSNPEAVNDDTTYSIIISADVYEVSWFLLKFRTLIEFSCGTMGSDKILFLLEYVAPLVRVRIMVCLSVLQQQQQQQQQQHTQDQTD